MSLFKPQTLIPALQLVAGVVLIQWHAIEFWTDTVDRHTGWALSIMIEVVALSFWWSRHIGYRFLALTATVILLAGPAYHLGQPVYQAIQQTQGAGAANAAELARLEDKREELKSNLQTFRKGVELRPGFGELVVQTTAKISELDQQIETIETRTAVDNRIPWETIVPVVLYIWVLMLVQINNVRMIRLLAQVESANGRPASRRPRPTEPRPVHTVRTNGTSRRLGVQLRGEGLHPTLN